jgi:hypothetical protein
VNDKARKQLQCIAKAGDGNYYDAGNPSDLEEAIRRLTQRALRPFQMSGTPVKGTVGPSDAPQIGPGQYKDRYDASGTPRYYRITRTRPRRSHRLAPVPPRPSWWSRWPGSLRSATRTTWRWSW